MSTKETKILKDYEPPQILLPYDSMINVAQEYERQYQAKNVLQKNKELYYSAITLLFSISVTIIPLFFSLHILLKIILGIVEIGAVYYAIHHFLRYQEAKKYAEQFSELEQSLDTLVTNKAQKFIRYTAIMRIVYKNNKNEMQYLIGNDFFLPHCKMDPNKTLYEQSDIIIKSLEEEYKISAKDILEVTPIDEQPHFSIKPLRNDMPMDAQQHVYVFYDVSIKIQSKKKFINSNGKRNWMSIDSMNRHPEAVAYNKDVINLLTTLSSTCTDSFKNILGDINIIWNITSKCNYSCDICATYDPTRQELSPNEKLKVLNNIFTAKKYIKALDFAGGDPFASEDSNEIIQTAINQLGIDKVAVTTTGYGIEILNGTSLSNSVKHSDLFKHCEITIDAAHETLSKTVFSSDECMLSRKEKSYCHHNIEQINLLFEYAESVTINVPIINDDLTEDEINNLVDKIKKIKLNNPLVELDVLLIRLMPVGKLGSDDSKTRNCYLDYNPLSLAKTIKKRLEEHNITCNYHCSLRVLPNFDKSTSYCTMLKNKLGIDCAGNVFACAWGGYCTTGDKLKDNPFYLGNLTQTPLLSILTGESKTNNYREIFNKLESNQNRQFCSVVSFHARKKIFDDYDYLSKKAYHHNF